jgi:hypothetical protein
MAMKESVGSLRAYFIVVALLAGFQNAALLVRSQGNIIIVIIALLGFAIGYLYIGIALRELLVKSSKIITGVILVSMGFLVVVFLLSLLGGVQAAMVAQLIIGLLIAWYLLKNVKRLSSEEQGKRIA